MIAIWDLNAPCIYSLLYQSYIHVLTLVKKESSLVMPNVRCVPLPLSSSLSTPFHPLHTQHHPLLPPSHSSCLLKSTIDRVIASNNALWTNRRRDGRTEGRNNVWTDAWTHLKNVFSPKYAWILALFL